MNGLEENGEVRECLNLRRAGRHLRSVGMPEKLGSMGWKPLYADTLGGELQIFTQEDDGTVNVHKSGKREDKRRLAEKVGRVEQQIMEGASVGDFVIFKLEDGRLIYLYRDLKNKIYRWLGMLPALPQFTLSVNQGSMLSETVSGVSFPTAMSAAVNPVSPDISRRVWNVWQEGYLRLRERIHALGQWCEDIDVRMAVRLWDGTRLYVSEPIRLSNPSKPGRTRYSALLTYDGTKQVYTGVSEGTVSGSGYNFSVSIGDSIPEEWNDIISGFEIWVSRETDGVELEEEPRMSFGVNSGIGTVISFAPPVLTEEQIMSRIMDMPLGMAGIKTTKDLTGIIKYSGDVEYDNAVLNDVAGMPGFSGDADCILGYGAFLHIGSGDDVYTSMRGNPFVAKSVTRGIGTRVRSMKAQLVGGGAFTRQYIYVSTDRGIVALTHKPDGEHTNARPITQETLDEEEQWIATPDGVYALTSVGSIVRISDAKVKVVMSHRHGVVSMLWSNSYEELWICGLEETFVIQTKYNSAYTRTDNYKAVSGVWSPALVYSESNTGEIILYTIENETDLLGRSVYEIDIPLTGSNWCRIVTMYIRTEGEFKYRITAPTGRRLAMGCLFAPVNTKVQSQMLLPRIGNSALTNVREVRVRLTGVIKKLIDIFIT